MPPDYNRPPAKRMKAFLIAAVIGAALLMVVLHLTGVIGPGSH